MFITKEYDYMISDTQADKLQAKYSLPVIGDMIIMTDLRFTDDVITSIENKGITVRRDTFVVMSRYMFFPKSYKKVIEEVRGNNTLKKSSIVPFDTTMYSSFTYKAYRADAGIPAYIIRYDPDVYDAIKDENVMSEKIVEGVEVSTFKQSTPDFKDYLKLNNVKYDFNRKGYILNDKQYQQFMEDFGIEQ